MVGDRIVNVRTHAMAVQMLAKAVAILAADHEEMSDIVRSEIVWAAHARILYLPRIAPREAAALLVPAVEMRQLDPQHRRLHFVKPAVASAGAADPVLAVPAILAQFA